jgi:hypothetical protein
MVNRKERNCAVVFVSVASSTQHAVYTRIKRRIAREQNMSQTLSKKMH